MSEPLVGIGLPTYNGERYLREALDALLAQDYPNLRLFISDNASTDGTARICLDAAERDERVAYSRTDANIGAVRNFNRTFGLATGDYFMWAADDDRWHPSYIRRCIEALEANRSAVMATTGLRFMDESGTVLERDYAIHDNPDLSSTSTVRRAGVIVRRAGWYQVYGVSRREALARTRLFRDGYGPDVALTMEMALLGPILKIPDVLFWYRQPPARTHLEQTQRQGHIPNAERVLDARHTYLQESLTDAVNVSALPRRVKAVIAADILRATYLEDTYLASQTIGEVETRTRFAVADGDFGAFVKFASLGAYVKAQGIGRRSRRRIRRVIANYTRAA